MGDRVTLAQKLVDKYRPKAVELLVDYLQNKDIRMNAEQYIGQHDPSPGGLDTAFEQHHGSLPTRSHHRNVSQPQTSTRQNMSNARQSVYTPPTSAGSVKSHASSMAAAGVEKIYFLSSDDDGADVPVISRSATGKHNLIRDQVALYRGLGTGKFEVNESVPVHHPSRGLTWEHVRYAVDLTWRRRNEYSTNVDTFYIVPDRSLDCDVVLGSDGPMERQLPSDVQEAHSPQARYSNAFGRVEEIDPPPPHVPTSPIYAYQQSSLPPPAVQQTYERVQAMRDNQRTHAADPSASAARPKHADCDQPTQTMTPLAPREVPSGQLLVIGVWDKTPIKMSFDPSDTGEAFYQAFHQWAVKRGRVDDLDRKSVTLMLKANKNMPDKEAYELGLEESELEVLWEAAVDWILEHKNPKAPHLFATVELEAGWRACMDEPSHSK